MYHPFTSCPQGRTGLQPRLWCPVADTRIAVAAAQATESAARADAANWKHLRSTLPLLLYQSQLAVLGRLQLLK